VNSLSSVSSPKTSKLFFDLSQLFEGEDRSIPAYSKFADHAASADSDGTAHQSLQARLNRRFISFC